MYKGGPFLPTLDERIEQVENEVRELYLAGYEVEADEALDRLGQLHAARRKRDGA